MKNGLRVGVTHKSSLNPDARGRAGMRVRNPDYPKSRSGSCKIDSRQYHALSVLIAGEIMIGAIVEMRRGNPGKEFNLDGFCIE